MSSGGCFEITYQDFNVAKAVTVVMNTLVCLLCIIAAVLIVFLKAYKRLIPRLMLIMMVATFFIILTQPLELLIITYQGPTHNGTGSVVLRNSPGALIGCLIGAWLGNFFLWVIEFLWIWLSLHLILSLHGKNCCIKERWLHVIGPAIALIFSAFPFIPLCPGKPMGYGLVGLHCGFPVLTDNCTNANCQIAIKMLLLDIPFTTGLLLVFGIVGFMLLKLCLKARNRATLRPTSQVQYGRALGRTWVLIVIIFIVVILFLSLATDTISANLSPKQKYDVLDNIFGIKGGWMVFYAAVEPILLALFPISVLVQPGTLGKLRWSELKLAARRWTEREEDTEYVVTGHHESSRSGEEEERLVIRGGVTSSGGHSIASYGINEI